MSKKSIIIIFLLIISPIIIYFLWPTDESRIKKLVKEGATAIEKEDVETTMSKVSFNYHDEHGLNYILLKRILEDQFRKMSDIRIEYENLKITVNKGTASAELDLRVIATIWNQTGYIIGDIKTPTHLKFSLEKERTKWLVTKTEGLDF